MYICKYIIGVYCNAKLAKINMTIDFIAHIIRITRRLHVDSRPATTLLGSGKAKLMREISVTGYIGH